MNTFKCSLLSASLLALSTGWAAAAPAVVLDWLNLRFGPGYDAPIVEIIPAGWIIDAGGCANGWCRVSVDGVPGFVDANYLAVPAPTAYYWGGWAYPNYAYYNGYYGTPYLAPDGYARAQDADVKAAHRLADHGKHPVVAKNTTMSKSRLASLASTGGPTKSDRNKKNPRG
jgi:uncharacterized protein YraI